MVTACCSHGEQRLVGCDVFLEAEEAHNGEGPLGADRREFHSLADHLACRGRARAHVALELNHPRRHARRAWFEVLYVCYTRGHLACRAEVVRAAIIAPVR